MYGKQVAVFDGMLSLNRKRGGGVSGVSIDIFTVLFTYARSAVSFRERATCQTPIRRTEG